MTCNSGGTSYWVKGFRPIQILPNPTQMQWTTAKVNSSELAHHQFKIITVNVIWSCGLPITVTSRGLTYHEKNLLFRHKCLQLSSQWMANLEVFCQHSPACCQWRLQYDTPDSTNCFWTMNTDSADDSSIWSSRYHLMLRKWNQKFLL